MTALTIVPACHCSPAQSSQAGHTSVLLPAPNHAPQGSTRAWDSCSATGPGSFQCLGLFSLEFLSLKSLLWCKREKSGLPLAFHPQTAGGWMLQQFSSARGSPERHKQVKFKHPRKTAQVCRGGWEFAKPTCCVLIISA